MALEHYANSRCLTFIFSVRLYLYLNLRVTNMPIVLPCYCSQAQSINCDSRHLFFLWFSTKLLQNEAEHGLLL